MSRKTPQEDIVEMLINSGWKYLGDQPRKRFVTYTGGSPIPNAEMIVGGRMRFCLPETNHRATVGPRTICFFDTDENKECINFQNFRVRDPDIVAIQVEKISMNAGEVKNV